MRRQTTTDFFIGARLGAARSQTGITLEQAAKDTRIRVQRLREIEADDFSGFAHPAYARLFLLDYANYLGVPAEEIRPILPENRGVAVGGLQYLDALAEMTSSSQPSRKYNRRSWIIKLLAMLLVLVILIIAGFYVVLTLRKLERVSRSNATSVSSEQQGTTNAITAPTPPPATISPSASEAPQSIIQIQEPATSEESPENSETLVEPSFGAEPGFQLPEQSSESTLPLPQ